MSDIDKLKNQQEKVKTEIRQLENRQKILLNRKTDAERKARTRLLIEHGAILESIFPAATAMNGEEVKAFLSVISRLPEVVQLLKNKPESQGMQQSKKSNGALIHRSGACALPGAWRPLDAMGRYTPQTPCALRRKGHPLCV